MNFIENFFSKYPEDKVIKWFKTVCFAEGLTCFLLYLVAMPIIRYYPERTFAVILIIIAGNLHGLFFTLYLLLGVAARKIFRWDDEDSVFALLAAFFPFATIWVEKKLARFDRE